LGRVNKPGAFLFWGKASWFRRFCGLARSGVRVSAGFLGMFQFHLARKLNQCIKGIHM